MIYRVAFLVATVASVMAADTPTYVLTGAQDCSEALVKTTLFTALSIAFSNDATKFPTSKMTAYKNTGDMTVGIALDAADEGIAGKITTLAADVKATMLQLFVGCGANAPTALDACTSDKSPPDCSGPPPSPPGGDPCFPSSAIVTTADGSPKRIDSLKAGDAILSATLDGAIALDTVSLLSIPDSAADGNAFLMVTTDGKRSLNATYDHHVATGAKCCSEIKQMKKLEIGDTMWVRTEGKPLPIAQKVTDIKPITGKGLHSPVLTNGGLPIVNNFVTSFDKYSTVKMARSWLPSMLAACETFGACSLVKKIFGFAERKHIEM